MYTIAHIADTHIRNLKYHDEYRIAFRNLYESLAADQPDFIVHCGDIAHTKTQLSPEYFQLCAEFLSSLANIAPTYVILGNHDGNLKNENRQDAVTPIVNALRHPSLHLLKNSGEVHIDDGVAINVLSVFDRDNWIKPTNPDKINIALYHGAIAGSQTGANWTMDQGDDRVTIFRDFDFAMLGDIHRQQKLDAEGRVRYCGSTIQQKFSESPQKGYLLWKIESKDKFNAKSVHITNPRPFITIRLTDAGNLPDDAHAPRNCRLRLVSKTNLPSDKLRKARALAEAKWSPYSVTVLNGKESSTHYDDGNYANSVISENLRDISVQEKHIRDYLSDMELEEPVLEKVLEYNKKYNILAEQGEEISRNVIWKIKDLEWDNLFNYGEKNKVNFTNLRGLVGIFGRNYSGKSSIIDSLLFTLFNSTSKGERKNVYVVNQNRERAKGKVQIDIGDKTYQVVRNLEKYRKKSRKGESLEARVDLDFSLISEDESLNGTTRNETDANIRKRFGTMEDFLLTSMSSQLDSLSFVKEGVTKRKEILAKFLDLQVFDKKFKLAKKEATELKALVKKLNEKQWDKEIVKHQEILEEVAEDIEKQRNICSSIQVRKEELVDEMLAIQTKIDSIPAVLIDIDKVSAAIIQKQKRRSTLLRNNVDVEKSIKSNESALQSCQVLVKGVDYDKLVSILDKASSLEDKIKELESKRRTLVRDQDALNKKIKMLHNHEYDPDCVYCSSNKFVKDAEKAKKTLPKVTGDISDLDSIKIGLEATLDGLNVTYVNAEARDYRVQMESINECKRNIETLTLTLSSNNDKISLLNNEIADMQAKAEEYENNRETIENLGTLNREKAAIEKFLKQKKVEYDRCQDKITKYLIEQGSSEATLKSLLSNKKELEDIEKEWVAYDLFLQCMHPNGIPYRIIKQKLPLLNEEIAKILGNIVDFEVFFESVGDKLDINIKHPFYDPRPLSMGSGAEKTLASMAIRLALITITNLPKSELFILDEPATALDQEHMEGFTNLLRLVKNQFKTVILISHLDSLKDVVDMTIDIDKVDGYANVRI